MYCGLKKCLAFFERRLWRYVTGDIIKPTQLKDESDDKFNNRLDDWDSKNHQILTWFCNTCAPSIKVYFGKFKTAKDV